MNTFSVLAAMVFDAVATNPSPPIRSPTPRLPRARPKLIATAWASHASTPGTSATRVTISVWPMTRPPTSRAGLNHSSQPAAGALCDAPAGRGHTNRPSSREPGSLCPHGPVA